MNRTRRKAAKMFRRKYGKATNPYWVRRQFTGTGPTDFSAFEASMRKMFEFCANTPQPNQLMILTGIE